MTSRDHEHRSEPGPVRLLDVDAALLRAVPQEQTAAARGAAIAFVIAAEPGPWRPPPPPTTVPFVGLLILDGVLAHDVSLGATGCTELLGPGDLLRAGEDIALVSSVPFHTAFHVEQRARLAVLDGTFVRAAARWPELMCELVARSARRSECLAMHLAVAFLTGTDARLHALLWHLADRWGRVEPAGVVLPLALSHDRLARLVRGRRPGVTQALTRLADRDLVLRRDDGSWLLRGGPPAEPDRARSKPDPTIRS